MVVTESCSCDRNNINLKNHDMSQQNFVDFKNSECSLIFKKMRLVSARCREEFIYLNGIHQIWVQLQV